MAGIYIHIPFCRQACHYCDFHFSVNQQTRAQLVAAISAELLLQKDYLQGEVIETIYLGGGTPSLLSREEIDLLLNTISQTQTLHKNIEVTLEANPDDLTPTQLSEFKKAGINRLSIGIQTFNSSHLKSLNRIHDEASAITSFYAAREAGFNNISIDLMYALPGETDTEWKHDIRQAIELSPEHISCYSLTIEEKTAFGKWAAAGKLKPEPDEVSARHLELLMHELANAGYQHYEISNFAKPGLHSNHNSNYWRGVKYLGVGPSAHSFNGTSRQYNVANNPAYLKAIEARAIPFEKEILSRENKINEYILTTLRTSWGTNLAFVKRTFDYDLMATNQNYVSQLLSKELVSLENEVLKLTNSGKLLADKISSDLFCIMIIQLTFNNRNYQADLNKPNDISLPLQAGDQNPNCYWAEPVKMETIRSGDFTGSVKEGGSVNYQKLTLTPHGNGTHTECYGHISSDGATLNQCLKEFHFIAEVITVTPEKIDSDLVITRKSIAEKVKNKSVQAVVIRTLPNADSKRITKYSGTNPPYLDHEAAAYLVESGVQHLLIDLPSVDRESDEGRLLAHKAFWQFPERIRATSTITELIFVAQAIPDGLYLLNLQITSLEMDASPGKPVLYNLTEVS